MASEHLTQAEPSDIEAEQWLLSGMMWDPSAVTAACETLTGDDFYRPAHQEIFNAIVAMFACSEPVDPVTLSEFMERELGGMPRGVDRMYLATLYGLPVVAGSATAHARIVKRLAQRRQAVRAGIRVQQIALEPGLEWDEMLNQAIESLTDAQRAMTDTHARRMAARSAALFGDLQGGSAETVIPGLLSRQDRVILVAPEGEGKSMLGQQVGVAASAGVHPFAFSPIPPVRVMMMDFETPLALYQRRLRRFTELAARLGDYDPNRLTIVHEPGGVDLSDPADRFALSEQVRKVQPDLIVAGPIYKMIRSRGQNSEELHSYVTEFWDRLRSRYNPALWLEHHPPKGWQGNRKMEPLGSSIYMRWPEFGLTLERAKQGSWRLGRFRGDREEGRAWPSLLTRSSSGGWPWEATYPQGTFMDPPDGAQ